MARELGQAPPVDLGEQSIKPLLKSLAVLLIATTIAIAIGPYTMKKPVQDDNATASLTAAAAAPPTTTPIPSSSSLPSPPASSHGFAPSTLLFEDPLRANHYCHSNNNLSSAMPSPTPVDQLSNAQIKEELRALYAVTDFGDCIEPGDLQKKLQSVRDATPITHGLRYGALLEIGYKKNPTGVVTIGHGLGDSAYGWEDVGNELARRLPYLLFLLPSAPSRPVTINGGMTMPAWYDITDMIGESLRSGKQDAVTIKQSCDYIRSLAHVATRKYSIPPSRVVYAGFSQGAAIALSTGLTAQVAPAGIACMSGYLAAASDIMPRIVNKAVPITMFHGRQDPVVPIRAAKESKAMLEEAGVAAIDFKEYNMQHSAVPQEINDLTSFIGRVLPEKF